jgi:hypothetical protein
MSTSICSLFFLLSSALPKGEVWEIMFLKGSLSLEPKMV